MGRRDLTFLLEGSALSVHSSAANIKFCVMTVCTTEALLLVQHINKQYCQEMGPTWAASRRTGTAPNVRRMRRRRNRREHVARVLLRPQLGTTRYRFWQTRVFLGNLLAPSGESLPTRLTSWELSLCRGKKKKKNWRGGSGGALSTTWSCQTAAKDTAKSRQKVVLTGITFCFIL